jgi:PAS domain S-box-containing protein
MDSNKKPVEKSVGTKSDKKSVKIAKPSFPVVRQEGEAGSIAKRDKKSSTSGNSSASGHIDISALTKLLSSNEQGLIYFKNIFATVHEPLLVLDGNLRVISANRSFYKFFKVKPKETVGNLVYDLGNQQWRIPSLRALLETILPQKAFFNDYVVEHEFPIIGRRIMLLNARQIRGQQKESHLILLAFEDATLRIQLERTIEVSEQRFRAAFDTASDIMLLVDKTSGKVVNSNRAAKKSFGYSEQKLLEKNLWDLDILKDQQHFKQIFAELEKRHNVKLLNKTIQTGQGRSFPADIYLMDKATVIQCNIRNISERVQAEAKIMERHATLNAILENSTTPVFSLDRNYRYTSFNTAHASVMNALFRTEIEIGQSLLKYQALPEDRKEAKKNIDRALRGEQVIESAYSGELGIKRRYFEVTHNPIKDTDGAVIGVSVFSNDVTERKQAEQALQEYSEHLETDVANRTRELRDAQEKLVHHERLAVLGQIAGSVSHELRNPLGVINSAIYYLKMVQPDADDNIRQYHAMIEQEVQNAKKIINDLLDFVRGIPAHREPVSVPDLVQHVLEQCPVPPSVQVALKLPIDLPKIYADPYQMEQVLGNLLVNACQAMGAGGKLTILARQQREMVALTVKDTGTGITPENIPKLFEPLFTTKSKGIGLGLTVSKKLINANDGRIEVQSKPGKGSAFTVTLPVHNN